MNSTEAIALIVKGARIRGKSIPDVILPLLLNFDAATPGIRHPLFKMMMSEDGIDGRAWLDSGKTILLLGSPGGGKTVTACCMGLMTGLWEQVPICVGTDEETGEGLYENRTIYQSPRFSYHSTMDYLDKSIKRKKDAPDPKDVKHLLILDDFGHEHTVKGNWSDKRLSELLLHRFTYAKPTIIISNKLAIEIRNDYAEHIVSRLFDKEHTKLIEYFTDKDMRSE